MIGEQDQPLPEPEVEDLQQQSELDEKAMPVRPVGPVLVQQLPARIGLIRAEALTTAATKILYADPKRRRAILIAEGGFSVSKTGTGEFAPWPTNAPLVLEHCDEVWARSGSTATLTVITEVWAD